MVSSAAYLHGASPMLPSLQAGAEQSSGVAAMVVALAVGSSGSSSSSSSNRLMGSSSSRSSTKKWWGAACASATAALVATAGGRRRIRRRHGTEVHTRLQASFSLDAWRKGFFDVGAPSEEGFDVLEVADLPNDLAGSYFRVGPGKFQVEGIPIRHQLDADGLMLAVTFNGDGRVAVRHRLVQTQGLLRDLNYKRIVQNGAYGTQAEKALGGLKNPANIGALWYDGRLMALWPYGMPFMLDPASLGTIIGNQDSGETNLGGVLREEWGFAASPKVCSTTGNLVNFYSEPSAFGTKLLFYEFLAGEDWRARFKFCRSSDAEGFTTFFDFAVTPNWFIVASPPVKVDVIGAAFGKPQLEVLDYDPGSTGKFYVVSREKVKGAKEFSIPGDSVVVKEIANAYEIDGGRIILDAVVTEEWPITMGPGNDKPPQWETEDPSSGSLCKLVRYELDVNGQTWQKRVLCERHIGFVSVAPVACGIQHRNVYCGVAHDTGVGPMAGVARIDTETGEVDSWVPGSEEFGAAPLFVPKEGSNSEEDGYILNVLLDAAAQKSSMAIFDARNLAQGPISRFDLPVAMPHGQRAAWAPGMTFELEQLKQKVVLLRMFEKKTQSWNAFNSSFSIISGNLGFARQGGKMR